MKRNIKKIFALALPLVMCFGLGVSLPDKSEEPIETNAIGNYSTNPDTYYDGITATSGKQLAAQLHDLIASTHRYYSSYADNGGNGYQKQTDQYYENGAKVSGYIYEFYSGVKWPNAWDPNSGSTTGGYNREHCWCQSNSVTESGVQMWGESGGGADMHHLRPSENRLNSTRGNHPYGEVSDRDSHKTYAKFGTNATYALGGYYYSDTFEPLDSKKGDVARIIMYVYLHYNSYTNSTLFGNYGTTNGNGNSGYFTSSLLSVTKIMKPNTESAALALLLDWNEADPVDDIEIRRNNQVAIYQGNRNPFIDNSNYANMIWGDGGSSNTPTVNSVTVSPTSLNLDLNGTTTGNLSASVNVSNGAPQTITWSSSNTDVATVSDNGVVTVVSKGTCTITARSTYNSSKYGTCSVKVINSAGGGGGGGSDEPQNGIVKFGTATGSINVTSGYVTGDDSLGNTWSVTTDGESVHFGGTEDYAQIGSKNNPATSITFSTTLSSEMFITAFSFKVGGNSSSSGSVALKVDSTTIGNGNVASSATTTINATDLIQSGTVLTITVTSISRSILPYSISYTCQSSSGGNAKSLSGITLNTSNVQNEFYVNDVFDYSGLEVVAQYSDGTEETVEPTSVSTPDLTTSGTKTVNVSYAENGVTKESSYNISVLEKVVTGIYASTQKTYHPGEKILKEDIYAEDNFGNELDEFEFLFDEYVFTYADAASGGNNTIKTFEDAIVTDDFVCDLSVTVSRNNYQDSPEYDDVMTKSWTGASGTTYSNWSNKTLDSGVVYAGNSAAGNNSIQMRSDKSSSGIVITSNSNNLEITSVSISWNPSTTSGRKVDIYAKENAYSEPTDLYDSESQGTKVGSIVVGDADPLSLPEGTTFIGIRSSSGAVYLDNITIKYGGGDTAKNVSNYIMFEDENNQCLTKLDVATGYFENLSESEQEIFMNSTDYVISTARERLIAWAAHEGKAITTNSEGKYVISKLLKMNGYGQTELDNNSSTVILLVICTVGGGAVSILYLLKKKKKAQ